MPKEERKVKEKIQLAPNVLYPGQSRFAYKTNDGSIFVISFKLKNITPNTITYIVKLFLLISEKEIKFIKEFSFDSSYVSNNKINRLLRQISNKNFKKCPDNYEEFNNEVSKEIIAYILNNNNNKSLKSGDGPVPPPEPHVSLTNSPPNTDPQEGLKITYNDITYVTSKNSTNDTIEATIIGNTLTNSTSTKITIPKTIEDNNGNTYTVTNISTNPETSLGAFQNSSYLSTITIPDSVTTIVSSAFQNCNNLVSVILPNNSSFTIMNNNTFQGCTSLSEVTIWNWVTIIPSTAFQGCTSLQNPSNYGTVYTNSTSGQYVYDYFTPANGFYVNIEPISSNNL